MSLKSIKSELLFGSTCTSILQWFYGKKNQSPRNKQEISHLEKNNIQLCILLFRYLIIDIHNCSMENLLRMQRILDNIQRLRTSANINSQKSIFFSKIVFLLSCSCFFKFYRNVSFIMSIIYYIIYNKKKKKIYFLFKKFFCYKYWRM